MASSYLTRLTIPVLKKIDFSEKYGPYSGATSTHKGCLKRRFACEALDVHGMFDFEVLAGTLTAYYGAAMLPDHPPIGTCCSSPGYTAKLALAAT